MLLAFIETWDAQIHAWASALGWPTEGLLRLVLAVVAGGLVGLEREVRGRQAGFRTNMLVCFGSALVMIVSIQFASHPWQAPAGININVDPARIAYGVMTGVGFLGAGTILQHRGSVRGLTTAAGIWCVAAVGLALGFGLYLLSAMATVLILMALWFFDFAEVLLPKHMYRTIKLRTPYHPGCLADTVSRCRQMRVNVIDAGFKRDDDPNYAEITLQIMIENKQKYFELDRHFAGDDKVQFISASDS